MNKQKNNQVDSFTKRSPLVMRPQVEKVAKESFWVRRVRPVMKFLLQVVGAVFVVGTSLMYIINQFTSHNFQFGYAVGLAIFANAVALFLIFDNKR